MKFKSLLCYMVAYDLYAMNDILFLLPSSIKFFTVNFMCAAWFGDWSDKHWSLLPNIRLEGRRYWLCQGTHSYTAIDYAKLVWVFFALSLPTNIYASEKSLSVCPK